LEIFREYAGEYLEAVAMTVGLTLASFALALVLGTVVATARVSPIGPARAAGAVYVETVRNIPLLLVVLLFGLGLPKLGFRFSLTTWAILAIGVYTAAFVGETIRSGINSVARGQAEAARSIGLTFPQTLGYVILPQAFRTVVQPLGSVFIALIKNTSLATAIGVVEITGRADRVNTATAESLVAFGIAALLYLSLTLPSGLLVGVLERRIAIKR
jgi:glutamate transport system permease protein